MSSNNRYYQPQRLLWRSEAKYLTHEDTHIELVLQLSIFKLKIYVQTPKEIEYNEFEYFLP